MENLRMYLSGGMGNLSFEDQSKWRREIANIIKECDYEKSPIFFNPVNYYNFKEKHHKSEREIFEFDLYNLRNSDLVVVNFNDSKSIGTAMELAIAKEYHIPVIGINEGDKDIHPWLLECCTRICDSLKECVEHIIEFYLN